MKKGLLVTGIILTIINIVATVFCGYLNAGIVYEGEGAIALIAIIPYTFIVMPIIIVLLIISLVCLIKATKSESKSITLIAKIFLGINIAIIIAVLVMIGRIIPLFFNN